MGIEEKIYDRLIEKSPLERLNSLEINYLYNKYEELGSTQKKYLNSMIDEFLNDREYCATHGITYGNLKELKDPMVKKELIADAYRLQVGNFREMRYRLSKSEQKNEFSQKEDISNTDISDTL
jgi:hypothetical protein